MKVAEVDDVDMPRSDLVHHLAVKRGERHRLAVSLLGEAGEFRQPDQRGTPRLAAVLDRRNEVARVTTKWAVGVS
jgi:hypothetical protein